MRSSALAVSDPDTPTFPEAAPASGRRRAASAWGLARRPDHRGNPVSGATASSVDAYERALAAFVSWRAGVDAQLELALDDAPDFTMAHVLKAYLLVCSRDPESIESARPVLAKAATLHASVPERLHLAAIAAVIGGDLELARTRLAECLNEQPRDLLALHAVQAFDHLVGDTERMRERPAHALTAWSGNLSGYASLLTMQAFGLVEAGEFERAQQMAGNALELDPTNPRAHHVMAHVFEMTGRPDAGLRWMADRFARLGVDALFTTHCWWHMALFHLAQGEPDEALRLYEQRVRGGRSPGVADLIDATSLLWRIDLSGAGQGSRWHELAAAWSRHIDDRFCSFNDVHAALAFVGAKDWNAAALLERSLIAAQAAPTRHGLTTREIGLPACRALIAFGRGDYPLATTLMASLPVAAHRLGGSNAQRDVLYLTLMGAIERIRRPSGRSRQWHPHATRRPDTPAPALA